MGAKPCLDLRGIKMNGILEGRFLIKGNSYIIDLINVDFLTWKENATEYGTYWLKMHIGSKEARYVCSREELKVIIEEWTKVHGNKIEININELGEEDEFNE